MKKILFIDDDIEFGEVLRDVLINEGYEVDYAMDAYKGIEQERIKNYDLILVDLYLEKFTGTQLVEIIRGYNHKSRIIIMTNSLDDSDEVKSLQLGVDEYLRKNTSISIMLQRIKNVFHKPIEMSHNIYESSDEKLRLEKDNRLAIKNGQAVHLTQLEIDLLECFLTNQNKLLSRDEILSKVWKLEADGVYIDSRTVDVHVKNLRRKLNLKSIHSIRGVGYRWHEE